MDSSLVSLLESSLAEIRMVGQILSSQHPSSLLRLVPRQRTSRQYWFRSKLHLASPGGRLPSCPFPVLRRSSRLVFGGSIFATSLCLGLHIQMLLPSRGCMSRTIARYRTKTMARGRWSGRRMWQERKKKKLSKCSVPGPICHAMPFPNPYWLDSREEIFYPETMHHTHVSLWS